MLRFVILLLLLVVPAQAEQTGLSPPTSRVELRTFGLGFFPLDGKFTRFHGWMRYEPLNSTVCQVMLGVEASSLVMGSDLVQARITGPDFMDAARFPGLTFNGGCQGDTIAGNLTLHGETHPFVLDVERSVRGIVATGHLKRAEWGIIGHPLMGGSTIRIRVEFPNPPPEPHT